MPMNTESPDEPSGQVPIGGSSAARAALLMVAGRTAPPTTAAPAFKTPRRVIGPDFGCMMLIAFLLGFELFDPPPTCRRVDRDCRDTPGESCLPAPAQRSITNAEASLPPGLVFDRTTADAL